MLKTSDYCKYLPYDVLVQYEYYLPSDLLLKYGDKKYTRLTFDNIGNIIKEKNVKPYLRPISQMSEEITHKGKTIIPIVELAKLAGFDVLFDYKCIITEGTSFLCAINNPKFTDFVFYENCFFVFKKETGHSICPNQDIFFQKLNKWQIWYGDQSYFDKGLILKLEN